MLLFEKIAISAYHKHVGVIYEKMNRPVAYTPAIARGVQEQYVPDEIIVKFKNDATDTIEKQIQLQDSISTFSLSSDIVQLNSESKIKRHYRW